MLFRSGAIDNITRLVLPNNAVANVKPNQLLNVYVGRSAGTGENLSIFGFVFEYTSKMFVNR